MGTLVYLGNRRILEKKKPVWATFCLCMNEVWNVCEICFSVREFRLVSIDLLCFNIEMLFLKVFSEHSFEAPCCLVLIFGRLKIVMNSTKIWPQAGMNIKKKNCASVDWCRSFLLPGFCVWSARVINAWFCGRASTTEGASGAILFYVWDIIYRVCESPLFVWKVKMGKKVNIQNSTTLLL